MNRLYRALTLCASLGTIPSTAAASGSPPEIAEPHTAVSWSRGRVQFQTNQPLAPELNGHFLQTRPVGVTWQVNLRRRARFWRARTVGKVTIAVLVRPTNRIGRCSVSRLVNARMDAAPQIMDCEAAVLSMSWFEVLPSEFPTLGMATYEITVRAIIKSEGSWPITTPILAKSTFAVP